MTEALLLLPGMTANRRKRAYLADFFRAHTPYAVYLPMLPERRGLDACAIELRRFIRRDIDPAGHESMHVLAYIAGGCTLRAAFAGQAFPYRGRVVWVRSPIQERVPARLVARCGTTLVWLAAGRLALDLAATDFSRLPDLRCTGDQAVVLERGASRLARWLGLAAADFEALHAEGEFLPPGAAAVWLADESHDEVYTSAPLLHRIAGFLAAGSFAAS